MRTNAAQGPDEIMPWVLKQTADIISYPLATIFNRSMQQGVVPQDFRDALVCPIYKKGAKTNCGNYRPVSLTSVVGKLMERVIKTELVQFLETNELLSQNQHGFRRSKSCLTNLLEYMEKVTDMVDQGHSVDIIFLDYAKAFDKVPHKRLEYKLEKIGITGHLKLWIKEWLNRTS